MEVKVFNIDSNITYIDDVHTLYENECSSYSHFLSILKMEESLLRLLANGGDTATVSLFQYILDKYNVDQEEEAITTHMVTHIPYSRFAKSRHMLCLHRGILELGLYRDVKVHVVVRDGKYIGHLISYTQMNGVGVDDIYVSLAHTQSEMMEIVKVLLLHLSIHVEGKSLIAYECPSTMATVISSMRKREKEE